MADLHRTITEMGLDAFDVVARATSEKPKALRWTVLTLYRRRDTGPDDYPQFMAEIVGETKVQGEQRRGRRAPFLTLAKALSWGAFNQQSALFDELRRKALEWVDTHYQARSLQPVSFGGTAVDVNAHEIKGATGVLNRRTGFVGFEGVDTLKAEHASFRDALYWLYGPLDGDIAKIVQAFAADWAATPETMSKFAGGFYNAGAPIGPDDVLDVLEHEEEYGLPAWADVFRRSMRHFDREGFYAARNG